MLNLNKPQQIINLYLEYLQQEIIRVFLFFSGKKNGQTHRNLFMPQAAYVIRRLTRLLKYTLNSSDHCDIEKMSQIKHDGGKEPITIKWFHRLLISNVPSLRPDLI